MGADLIYSMLYMEVSEEEAAKRRRELTFEKLTAKDQKDNWLLRTHEDKIEDLFWRIEQLPYEEADEDEQKKEIANLKQRFVSDVRMDVAKAMDVAYGAWTHGRYPRDVAAFNVKGTKGLITAGMSWGDSWETLEQFSLLNILGITSDEEYTVRYFDEE